jgi:imidazolonepropionase
VPAARSGIIYRNCAAATLEPGGPACGLIEDSAIALCGGRIAWAGAADDLPVGYAGWPQKDLGGKLVTPALIDCHTHIVHGGNRAREFEMRLAGASYEEIARAGGGILATMAATRAASETELLASALPRIDALVAEGVAIIEIKSGYGLERDTELRILKVARLIGRHRPLRVVTSFLAAHALPPEYAGRADAYIDELCIPLLREAHGAGLVDAVDGFCETIAFNPAQIGRLFGCAGELGLPVKLHAGQLSAMGAEELAARHGALSADHLEHADDAAVAALAASGSCAVLLPGAFYTLRQTQKPPVAKLRAHHVPMAVATDCNPGSSPLTSLLLAMNMACTLFSLTPEEALAGVTREAAKALGLADCGMIRAGLRADLAIWEAEHPAELVYRPGFNLLAKRVYGGV